MGINDFIEQYTLAEVERIARKDSAVRIANKLSIQGVADQLSSDMVELSPIRGSQKVLTKGNRHKSPNALWRAASALERSRSPSPNMAKYA